MSEAFDTSLLPYDLSKPVMNGIRGMAFRSAAAVAMHYVSRTDGETVPEKAAADVYNYVSYVVENGNFGSLPQVLNDAKALHYLSGGEIEPNTHYPFQVGLLVARTGFEAFIKLSDLGQTNNMENSVMREAAGASAFHYIELGGTHEQECLRAAAFVDRQMSKAFRNTDPIIYIDEMLIDIKSGLIERTLFPDLRESISNVFMDGIKAALTVSQMTLKDLASPQPSEARPRCRDMDNRIHYRRSHTGSSHNY